MSNGVLRTVDRPAVRMTLSKPLLSVACATGAVTAALAGTSSAEIGDVNRLMRNAPAARRRVEYGTRTLISLTPRSAWQREWLRRCKFSAQAQALRLRPSPVAAA